jgi:hypothetical protein
MSKAPTTGEWFANYGAIGARVQPNIVATIGEARCGDDVGDVAISTDERDANARLFAASKDLLAACERAYAFHDDLCADSDISVQLRAAIAKAKGES